MFFKLICVLCLLQFINCTTDPIIVTSKGAIRGLNHVTSAGNEARLFLGLPYAEPPEYELRYKPPVPRKPWDGVLNCTYYKDVCPQTMANTAIVTNYTFSEDCLHVEVFAGKGCTPTSPCPVLNYIFGGANIFDGTSMFFWDPVIDNLASKGLVVVFTNFRVDSYAWFSTETDDARGNFAIYDQISALRWIQEEISKFGGDPNQVTIQGHSSGGESVTLIALSPKVEPGLFHQAVPMSGTGLSPGALKSQLPASRMLSIEAGCATEAQWDNKQYAQILACLRSKSFLQLNKAQASAAAKGVGFGGPNVDGPTGLFPSTVAQMAKTRRPYRYLMGFTNAEQDMVFEGLATIVKLPQQLVTALCTFGVSGFGFKHVEELSGVCGDAYESTGLTVEKQLGKVSDDVAMWMPGLMDLRSLQDVGAQVYLYSFEKPKLTGPLASVTTPYHAMDLAYLFGFYGFLFADPDETDLEMEKLYPQIYVNFAKYGNPTPAGKMTVEFDTWKPVAAGQTNYYKIDLPRFVNEPQFHPKSDQLWFETLPKLDQSLGPSSSPYGYKFAKETNKMLSGFAQYETQKPFAFNPYMSSLYRSNLLLVEDQSAGNASSTASGTALIIAMSVGASLVLFGLVFFVGYKKTNKRPRYEYKLLD